MATFLQAGETQSTLRNVNEDCECNGQTSGGKNAPFELKILVPYFINMAKIINEKLV